MSELQTRKIESYHYKDYLSRAEQCLALAEEAKNRGLFDACAINAIQSAISAADALSTFALGQRSASQRHDEAVKLFKTINPHDKGVQDNANRFSRIISEKNASAYEEKPVSSKEAQYLLLEAQRFLSFVKSKLPA